LESLDFGMTTSGSAFFHDDRKLLSHVELGTGRELPVECLQEQA
jgi:hypothetical protein